MGSRAVTSNGMTLRDVPGRNTLKSIHIVPLDWSPCLFDTAFRVMFVVSCLQAPRLSISRVKCRGFHTECLAALLHRLCASYQQHGNAGTMLDPLQSKQTTARSGLNVSQV